MSKATGAALKNWRSEDACTDDDMHAHFADFGHWHWCDIADEACRLYGVMFDRPCDSYSAVGLLFSGISAQASKGALSAVAACLGVSYDVLHLAVAEWSDNQEHLPPPIGIEGLPKKLAESQKFIDGLDDIKNRKGAA